MRLRSTQTTNHAKYYYKRDRDRYLYNLSNDDWEYWFSILGTPDTTSFNHWFPVSSSVMYDEVDPLKSKPFSARPCLHLRNSVETEQEVKITSTTVSGSLKTVWTITTTVPSLLSQVLGLPNGQNIGNVFDNSTYIGHRSTSKEDWQALGNRFEDRLTSFLKSSVSSGENIAEPGVFIDTLRAIISPRKVLKSLVKHVVSNYGQSIRRKNFGSAMKQVLRDTSGTYLYHQFGLKPVLNDLQAAFQASNQVRDRLQFLRLNQDKFVPIRTRGLLSGDSDNSDPDNVGSPVTLVHIRDENSGYIAMSCLAKVRKDIGPSAVYQAYAEYFGLNRIVGLAWELIPFSFVIDWVTNAGEFIDKYTRLTFSSPFSMTKDFCATRCLYNGKSVMLSHGVIPHLSSLTDGRVPLGFIGHKRYERMLTIPEERLVLDTAGWTSWHTITSGALATQKLLGLTRR